MGVRLARRRPAPAVPEDTAEPRERSDRSSGDTGGDRDHTDRPRELAERMRGFHDDVRRVHEPRRDLLAKIDPGVVDLVGRDL